MKTLLVLVRDPAASEWYLDYAIGLARDLNLTPATTCHHLEKLKLANLLSERRSGRHVYYSISNSHLELAVKQSLATLKDSPAGEEKSEKKKHPAKNI